MARPLPSLMPEAVRNSVSIRSEITGARAGIRVLSSSWLAGCQAPVAAACPPSARSRNTHANLVKVHDSPLQGGGRGLRAIGDPQLAEQAVDVGLDRSF